MPLVTLTVRKPVRGRTAPARAMRGLATRAALAAIRGYQSFMSPYKGFYC